MTIIELRKWINEWGEKNGLEVPIPSPQVVIQDTYINILNFLIHYNRNEFYISVDRGWKMINLTIGPNNGIIFKGIEWICPYGGIRQTQRT